MDGMNNTNQNNQQQYVGNTYDNQQVQQAQQAQQAQQNGYIQTPGEQPNYQQQNYQQQNYQQFNSFNAQPQQGPINQYMTWLIAGGVQALCLCCCCSWMSLVTSIVTIVFAVMANQAYNSNDLHSYHKNINIAKYANIVGWVLLVIGFVINIVAGWFTHILNTISNNIQ